MSIFSSLYPPPKGRGFTLAWLNGEFGNDPKNINPYAVSIFYAIDRFLSYSPADVVICDRYTTSNLIYHSSKTKDFKIFVNWVMDLEYNLLGLPKPDFVFFLDVPVEYSAKIIATRDNNKSETKKDIHEMDIKYLETVYQQAHKVADYLGWYKVPCVVDKKLKGIYNIADEIYNIIVKNSKLLD